MAQNPASVGTLYFSARLWLGTLPAKAGIDQWISKFSALAQTIPPPAGAATGWLDLSVGSLDIGHNRNFEDSDRFERLIENLMAEKGITIGAGGLR